MGWGCLTRETGRKGTPLLYPRATPALFNLEKQQPGPLASGRAERAQLAGGFRLAESQAWAVHLETPL